MVSTCDFDSQNSSSILLPPATYKPLVYAGVTYTQFLIDTDGNILNTKTNKIYKKSFRKRNGYLYAYLPLGKRGKVKAIRIHKAVAETFIPNPLKLEFVNHIDEDRTNCNISNLLIVVLFTQLNKPLTFCSDAFSIAFASLYISSSSLKIPHLLYELSILFK